MDLEEEAVSANFLLRNWPPALSEWSTKGVRDTFFAVPQFPRLSKPESIKRTIAEGVTKGLFGYAEKAPGGGYANLRFGERIFESDVEISEDVYLLQKEVAQATKGGLPSPTQTPTVSATPTAEKPGFPVTGVTPLPMVEKLTWECTVPPQKWMTFYTVKVEVQPKEALPKHKVDEAKVALRELGLSEELQAKEKIEEKRD